MSNVFVRLKKKWNPQGVAFGFIAFLVGVGTFFAVDTLLLRERSFETTYQLDSPSPVVTKNVTLDDSSVDVAVTRCQTWPEPIVVYFDTVWLYYPTLGGDSQPGVNGFNNEATGSVVNVIQCNDNGGETIPATIPLGDLLLREQSGDDTAAGGGMFPGFWSMRSTLRVYECLVLEENPDATSGFVCTSRGKFLEQTTWESEIFQITESAE